MEKIKQFIESDRGKDILVVLIVILVGLASFELGRLSKGNEGSGIKIQYSDSATNQNAAAVSALSSLDPSQINKTSTTTSASTTGKNFFASNRGSKYYSLGCSGGKTIKQENRVYFNTSAEAVSAGYELSSSCK